MLLAASVLLSRVLAYVREMVLAHQAGVSADTDAYRAAFQIPDLLNHFLAGGALAVAFIPLYTKHLGRGDRAGADRLLAVVLGTTGAVAVLATLVLYVFAEPLVALQFPRFDAEAQALTLRLTRIVLPAQIFFVAGGILRAALMAHGRFAAQAAAPVVYNLSIIAGGVLLAPRIGVEGFAWGALVGAAVGTFLIPLLDASRHLAIRLRVKPLDREFLGYLVVAAPLMLGLTLLTADELYYRWFGGLLAEGTVAKLSFARMLMQVPVAVVGQATAAAALPTFARLWSEGDRDALNRMVLRTLRVALAVGILGAAGLIALANPIVVLFYERGAFTHADSLAVAGLLVVFALAVPAWVAQQIAVRAFYARADTWRPMLLGSAIALPAVPLYLAFGARFGGTGIAAAGVLAISLNAIATLLLARRLHGGPALGRLLGTALRFAGIAAPAALAAHTAALAAHAVGWGGAGSLGALVDLALGGVAFGVVALAGSVLLLDRDTRDALRRLRPWRRATAPRDTLPS